MNEATENEKKAEGLPTVLALEASLTVDREPWAEARVSVLVPQVPEGVAAAVVPMLQALVDKVAERAGGGCPGCAKGLDVPIPFGVSLPPKLGDMVRVVKMGPAESRETTERFVGRTGIVVAICHGRPLPILVWFDTLTNTTLVDGPFFAPEHLKVLPR